MQITSDCQATDPRDELVAISHFTRNEEEREAFEDNCSLAGQHFWNGFFAHILIGRHSSPFACMHAG